MASNDFSTPTIENAQLIEGDTLKASVRRESGDAKGVYYSFYEYNDNWQQITSSDLASPSSNQGYIEFDDDIAILKTRFVSDNEDEGIERFKVRFFEDNS